MAFLGTVVSLPVPQMSFLSHANSNVYRSHPPALYTIVENIIPSPGIKNHLSRGLQSSSALVRHCTALTLGKCLNKLGMVVALMREAQRNLEEAEEDGLWSNRLTEVEREVFRRAPELQVVVAFAQQTSKQLEDTTQPPSGASNPTQLLLLSESAQRLLWLYHRHFSQLVAEVRLDVSKLLFGFKDWEPGGRDTGFAALRQLHTLRLLHERDEIPLTGKSGLSSFVTSIFTY